MNRCANTFGQFSAGIHWPSILLKLAAQSEISRQIFLLNISSVSPDPILYCFLTNFDDESVKLW